MVGSSSPTDIDVAEQVARIRRLQQERDEFIAEQRKLLAEAGEFDCNHPFRPGRIVAATVAVTAALMGGTVAVVRLFLAP